MSSVSQWAERVLRTVEQDGTCTHRVRLLTPDDGQVWETWYGPFGAPDEFATSVDSHIRSLEQEWPTRQIRVVLVAESAQGEVLSQLPLRVTGKLRGGSLDAMQAAQSATGDAIVNTVDKLTRLVNTNIDASRRHVELTLDTMVRQSELLNVYRNKAMQDDESEKPTVLEQASDLLKPYQPVILQLLEGLAKRGAK